MSKNVVLGSGKYGFVIKWKLGGTTTNWFESKQERNKEYRDFSKNYKDDIISVNKKDR